MENVSKIKAILTLENSKFKKGLADSKAQTKSFGSAMGKLAPMIAGAFSVVAITRFVSASVKAYDIQIKAETKLLTALKGRQGAQQRLIEQAQTLQKTTLFGDEATIEAQAMLASLGLNESAIRKLIPLVQDLATKSNMGLVQAADLVAKSVGSSTNALSRYGIVIEGAVGSAERLESAVSSMNEQVGGQSEAAAKVGTGAITQLGNAYGDLQENIGKAIVDNEKFAKSVNSLIVLVNTISNNLDTIITFADVVLTLGTFGTLKYSNWALSLFNDLDKVNNAAAQTPKWLQDVMVNGAKPFNVQVPLAPGQKPVAPVEVTVGLISDWETKLKALEDSLKDASGEEHIMTINVDISKAKAEIERLKALMPTFGATGTQIPTTSAIGTGFGADPTQMSNLITATELLKDHMKATLDLKDAQYQLAGSSDLYDGSLIKTGEVLSGITDEAKALNDALSQLAAEGITALATSLGELIGGANSEDVLENFIGKIAGLLKGFGSMLIAYGTSIEIMKSANGYAMIAAGAALVAIGAAMSTQQGKITGAAGGSGSYGSYGGGTFGAGSNYDYNREIIMVARGDDLVGVVNSTNLKNNYLGGV
jgi:hypothetical protein